MLLAGWVCRLAPESVVCSGKDWSHVSLVGTTGWGCGCQVQICSSAGCSSLICLIDPYLHMWFHDLASHHDTNICVTVT